MMIKEIELTQGRIALVDNDDINMLIPYPWYASNHKWTWYAKTDSLGKSSYMHRIITKAALGTIVHHKNGNGLDNRRDNLIVTTQSVNARCSNLRWNKRGSKYRGVYFHKQRQNYVAEITIDYKKKYLGMFGTEEEAALAYNNAVLSILGGSFPLNEII